MGFNHQQPILLLSLQETAAHDEKFNLSSIYLDVEIGKSSSMSDNYQHLEIICTRELNKFSLYRLEVFNLPVTGILPSVYSDMACGSFPLVNMAPSN